MNENGNFKSDCQNVTKRIGPIWRMLGHKMGEPVTERPSDDVIHEENWFGTADLEQPIRAPIWLPPPQPRECVKSNILMKNTCNIFICSYT